jgi:uncharacterized protein YfeS
MARTVPLKKRVAFLERADAVRRLQQIGRHREASLIKANMRTTSHAFGASPSRCLT